MCLGAAYSTNPFSIFATRSHANIIANILVVLLAGFEHSPLFEVVTLKLFSIHCPAHN